MVCLPRIEGVSRVDRVRNEDIRDSLEQVAVVDMMKDRAVEVEGEAIRNGWR